MGTTPMLWTPTANGGRQASRVATGRARWMTMRIYEGLTTNQVRELDEAYDAYETKAQTFQQSKQFQRAKGQSRVSTP